VQISEAADSALQRDPVWKLLEDYIGSEEIGDGFGRTHGSHRLQILMEARNVASCHCAMLLLAVVTLSRLGSVAEHKPTNQVRSRLRYMPKNRPFRLPFYGNQSRVNSHAKVSEHLCNPLRPTIIN
jgi:hypothetical protein